MIKLQKLVEDIYVQHPELGGNDDELTQKGYKLSKPEIDPETGASVSKVEYLPRFEEIRKDLMQKRKEFQAFKFSSNPDVAKISKDINTGLTKISQLIFALDKMIELQQKSK
jgi:hypothetical protein